jgi:electron transport complex protein RnfD
MNKDNKLLLQSSPHIVSSASSKALMRNMLIALAPVAIYGIVIFGLYALLNIIAAVVSAIAGESLFRKILKRPVRAGDFSAGVSGLLLALVIPPTTPLWMTAMGAVFAVVVAKEFFGGLGANIFNPALVGRAFLLTSFPAALTTWRVPGSNLGFEAWADMSSDVITGATPLETANVFDAPYWETMRTLFFGFHGGSTGETSIFLMLAACLFLLVTKTIDWRAPLFMVAAAAATAFALGSDPLFAVLSGGLIFGAVFMATDYVTGPVTDKGKIIFGIGAGVISILIRKWGNFPEGVSYGILIMNAATPFLDKLLGKKYGFVKKKKDS